MRATHRLMRQQCAAALRQRVDEFCQPAALTSLLEFTSAPLPPQQQQKRGLQIFEVNSGRRVQRGGCADVLHLRQTASECKEAFALQ